MLRFKDFQLIQLDKSTEIQITDLIDKQNGSIFHEPLLNQIISEKFNSKLFYLVDQVNDINSASAVHVLINKLGGKYFNLSPLGDMPYSGFIGKDTVTMDQFKIGVNEAISYIGFPYERLKDNKYEDYGETSMVDLTLAEDLIFSTFIHSKRRNMIRKAIKSGIVVREYNNQAGFDLIWPLIEKLHDRLKYFHLTREYYQSIFNAYCFNHKATILIAFKEDIPISGVFILGNRNFMHYYKGATSLNIENQGQGELLQWEAIKLAKRLGARYYDLCNLNRDKLPDIYKFKTGISNQIWTYPILRKKKLIYKVGSKLIKKL